MPTYTNKENYLLVEVSGVYSLKFFIELIHEVTEHGKKENFNKMLVDIRNVDGNPSALDRYQIGLEISKRWGKNIQVASLAKESSINFLVENVAVNRGANFQVFTEVEPALEWLGVQAFT